MPYKISLLKDNPSNGHGCPDQIVSGTAETKSENLKGNLILLNALWVSEGRSYEVSYVPSDD